VDGSRLLGDSKTARNRRFSPCNYRVGLAICANGIQFPKGCFQNGDSGVIHMEWNLKMGESAKSLLLTTRPAALAVEPNYAPVEVAGSSEVIAFADGLPMRRREDKFLWRLLSSSTGCVHPWNCIVALVSLLQAQHHPGTSGTSGPFGCSSYWNRYIY